MLRIASSVACADDAIAQKLGELIRRAEVDPVLELEARIGRVEKGKFVPGVTRGHIDKLVRSLDLLCDAQPDMMMREESEHPGEWIEEENYYYMDCNRRLRSRVLFDSGVTRTTTVEKRVVDSLILRTQVMDVRISLSREDVVKRVPSIVDTTHVRIKQRRSFGMTRSPFVIECSSVWSGKTKVEAEQMQMTTCPTFEVECEFRPSSAAFRTWRSNHDDVSAAASFLYKVSDIMMATGVHYVLGAT